MAIARIKSGDTVKVVAGGYKGESGKIVRVDMKTSKVFIEGLGLRKRNVKPSQLNPRGGTKEVHVGIDLSNVALVVDDKGKTSRVAYGTSKDGTRVRLAKALKNKEIK